MSRRAKIINVAKDLLARFGFKKTTMEDIARAAGIAKATVYHYFTSKEDILREIIQREGEILRQKLQEAVQSGQTASEKLRNYGFTRFRYLRKLALYYKTMSEEYYGHIPFIEREREKFDAFELDMLESVLREGMENGEFDIPDPRLYAFMLLQAVKGLEFPLATGKALKLDDREIDLDKALELLLGILINGIGRKPASSEVNHERRKT